MSLLSRIFKPSAVKHVEGEYHDGPWTLPVSGGWLSHNVGKKWNWWQHGHSVQPFGAGSAMVEACISRYSQTVAMCATEGDHWLATDNGGRSRVMTSALSRIIRKPNDYDSSSDFWLNITRALYSTGNAYALALRNDRTEITELHRMRMGEPLIAEGGAIFYRLAGNEIIERRFDLSQPIPARDVMHVRLHTPRHPLKGESPIVAAALDIAAGNAALHQQINFFANASRTSFILTTDERLTREQSIEARERWQAQTTGDNAGSTPILSAGLKPIQVSTSPGDAQLAETLKMSSESVALAFGIPLQILGIGGTPYASTEAMMQAWRATGLGFALNQVEEAFGRIFRLSGVPTEYVEFSTSVLMRSLFKERMEGLSKSTLSGIHSPDEARAELELPAVTGGAGKEPRVQQQVVPLSYGVDMKPPDPNAAAPAAAPMSAPPDDDPEEVADAERYVPDAIFARIDDLSRLH